MTAGLQGLVANPAIKSLLEMLVDKLDATQARGSASAQAVSINNTSWPALYQAPFETDKEHLWEGVLQLASAGWIQLSPAGASTIDGYDKKPRIKVINVASLRAATGRLERVKTAPERWREAVHMHLEATEEVKKIASEFCIELPGRDMVEIIERLNELKSLKTSSLLLREVSARLFWGMSKVLDNRAGLVAAVLEIDECPFPESPVQLQVYVPFGGFSGVLFIENQVNFERAIRSQSSAYNKLALVFASGFKGSAGRLRNTESTSLYFSNKGELSGAKTEYFETWLFSRNISLPTYFWGDLDWSGMRILSSLRRNFPGLQAWQIGYEPMLQSLLLGQGHAPEAADKGGQKPIAQTGCAYCDSRLLPALAEQGTFIDQELFSL